MKFNEDSRVKIPSILHLIKLGYTYLSLKQNSWDVDTNIFTDIFYNQLKKINQNLTQKEAEKIFTEVSLSLENEDLGRAFYKKLVDQSGIKLIDFENFENNSFHVVTELPYEKDDDTFRPDIILLINGMPLIFIEVKKPNNRNGIKDEHDRMQRRFQNKKFRKFINLTQLMVFSNNMAYSDTDKQMLEGAFYSTTNYRKPIFNYFREEEKFDIEELLTPVSDETENVVLKDTNLISIKNSDEFASNKNPNSATNTIATSLFQKDRLKFILQYAFAYVEEENGLEKHVMRYPQIFATKAIANKLENGIKKGIIWHTQGSGKTALAYFNVKHLTDFYQQKNIIPKFYFIVDRIDLLNQAAKEFNARGLVVHKVDSREAFTRDIKSTKVIHNSSGKAEITVVNIQKFKDDPDVIKNNDYNLSVQRVFFLDEVHRSYNPKGSFLANLELADKHSIKIGLTGTPLLGKEYNSKTLFGDYIHKYYYNLSIKDGYTLRLIREEIETKFKLTLQETLEKIKVLEGDADKKKIFAHHKFVEPMLTYIVQDLEQARIAMNDASIGGMVVCDSSDQAKMMQTIFQDKYAIKAESYFSEAAEDPAPYGKKKLEHRKVKKAQVILHDVGTKQERKDWIDDFKAGNIDLLFVYNMLQTGFDAKRLKKLYIGRKIKAHNLLQTLTRVNRTYKNHKYGFVVDFADIQKEFDKTNQDYFNELQSELGDELQHYSNLFKSAEEIEQEIEEIKDVLFRFDTGNAEVFSRQISEINDRTEIRQIAKVLNNSKELYNLIRLSGNFELLEQLDFRKLVVLSRMTNDRLALINTKIALETNLETNNILNTALEDVIFAFTKIKEEEMVLADELKDTLQKTREMLGGNFDPKDPVFVSLREELERLFKKKNLSEVSKEDMEANIKALNEIYDQAKKLERENQLLSAKYGYDAKYARIHKRLLEKNPLTDNERKLFEALKGLKADVDSEILQNSKILENERYVEKMIMRLVINQFKNKQNININATDVKRINNILVKEYINEYNGNVA
ncbi:MULTISPECIES: type I restriction endonuclease subunit R [unclassified Polaribacter]|uniref:type I restriction endonuclease subunit R n=1 Tax=unclassified Polaribacter TaxID=196858 RepID=UPI0011BDF965|nr:MULTISPECIES: type I restriction endonuclease [unclassified Polaribacter]TXD53633.1 type I restriction endonuclease subunit R [Polaribacter sp. IC063]TXD62127.1 type I restriction endonuclease subunit R [Polaribacter sp. IC066]